MIFVHLHTTRDTICHTATPETTACIALEKCTLTEYGFFATTGQKEWNKTWIDYDF
jgi:hypothetical protein